MIYIGTLEQCEQYDKKVTDGQNYQGVTTRWAVPKKHPVEDLYCIVKHKNYESDMELVESLSDDWIKTEEFE